jgi:ribose transport system substrate-binding protein
MKRTNHLRLLLGAVIPLLMLAACSTSNQSAADQSGSRSESGTSPGESAIAPLSKDGPLTISYIPITMNTQYTMTQYGMQEQIDRLGGSDFATLDVQAPASNDQSLSMQPSIMENAIAKGVDAIVLSTEDEQAMLPYMKKATEAGIPVFLTNMAEVNEDDAYFVSNIGYSQYDASHLIGEWVVDDTAGKDAKIGILEGYPGLLNDQRLAGFKDAIADHANLEVVASQTADWTRAKGQEVTENILTASPDIDIIYGMYDEMALGAVSAIKTMSTEKDIIVAGYDNTADGNAAIKNGELAVTVDTGSKKVGVELINAIKSFVTEGKAVDREINVPPTIVDATNVDEFGEDTYEYVPRDPE